MLHNIRKIILGNPLPTAQEIHERLTKVKALAVFSSDALSSVAYGPEEILMALMIAGVGALHFSMPIAIAIIILLAIVTMSYYQTIHAYPSGGGAYIVAYDNLGKMPGLIAAGSLLTDYVLTVAVSIASGIAALTSAFPELLPYRVDICIIAIILIAWANLRGVKESGTIFAAPTYVFIGIFYALIIVGVIRALTGSITPFPAKEAIVTGTSIIPLFIILRAFASGCSTLTGVEAISNGIPAFKKPESKNAGLTLILMAVILGSMTIGITYLANHLGAVPLEHETIASQIGRKVFGDGFLYMILQFSTTLILVLAANTSFADFPRLSSILARDGYLPRQMSNRGDRLVFSNGIIALAILSIVLVIIFEGSTHSLIPLYAVGVFLSFTLSQAGMVRHWQKEHGKGWLIKAFINGLGAVATFIVLIDVVLSKFLMGAWIVILIIPCIVWMFYIIKHHYDIFKEELTLNGNFPEVWTDLDNHKRHKVVIPVSWIHKGTLTALHFARSMTKDVRAVIINVDPRATEKVQKLWEKWGYDVPLVILDSPFRSITDPLLDYLEKLDKEEPERGLAVVMVPEFIPAKWWQNLLHNQTAIMLKTLLTYRRAYNGTERVIIDVPFHLKR